MRLVGFIYFWFGCFSAVFAGAPDLKSFLPMAARPGSTNVVVFSGSFEPWPPKVWCGEPGGIFFGAETNKNRFTVTVATDAVPGPRLVRVYNEDGVSEPQFFIVDASPQLEEKTTARRSGVCVMCSTSHAPGVRSCAVPPADGTV